MTLRQKINHIRRHKKNKKIKNRAEYMFWLAIENSSAGDKTTSDGKVYIVSTLLYEIIRMNYVIIPDCIKCSSLVEDNFMVVPREIIEFWNFDIKKSFNEFYGIFHKEPDEKTKEELSKLPFSMFTNPELYMHTDKAITPDITTLNGVRV